MTNQLQLPLFDQRETALAGLMPTVKAAMNRTVKNWCDRRGLKREGLLEQMNEMADRAGVSLTAGNGTTSMAVFEKWLAPRDTSNIPGVMAVNVFCLVTGDFTPLEAMLAIHGCAIMGREDKRLRDYGAALIAERKARKRKRILEAEID
ncbi:MAG: hypothetical protein KKE73_09560 [Proteobacteria bacterium]|nr:hypothetical protein [Pseudomonadota bacterium]